MNADLGPVPNDSVRNFLNESLDQGHSLLPDQRQYVLRGNNRTSTRISSTVLRVLACVLLAACEGRESVSWEELWHRSVNRGVEALSDANERQFRTRTREAWNYAREFVDPHPPARPLLLDGTKLILVDGLYPFVLARARQFVHHLFPPRLIVRDESGGPERILSLAALPGDVESTLGRAVEDAFDPTRLSVDNAFVSRRHALVKLEGDRLSVRRDEGKNPMFFRGEPSERFILSTGDEFRIGQLIFRFEAWKAVGKDDTTPLYLE